MALKTKKTKKKSLATEFLSTTEKIEGRCMRCQEQKRMKNPSIGHMANGRRAARGECPSCKTRMFRFLPSE